MEFGEPFEPPRARQPPPRNGRKAETMKKCTNSQTGTFNHECGKPATWTGTHPTGHVQNFCDDCKAHGNERHGRTWEPVQADPAAGPELLAMLKRCERFLEQVAQHLQALDAPGQAGNCTIIRREILAVVIKVERGA
jgi:hypothetical protein